MPHIEIMWYDESTTPSYILQIQQQCLQHKYPGVYYWGVGQEPGISMQHWPPWRSMSQTMQCDMNRYLEIRAWPVRIRGVYFVALARACAFRLELRDLLLTELL